LFQNDLYGGASKACPACCPPADVYSNSRRGPCQMNIGISVHRARDGAQNQVCNKARLCNTAHACNMKFVHLHAHTRAITLGRMGARAGAAHVLTRAQHITRAHVLERINARANTLSHTAYVLTRAQRINARAQACSRACTHAPKDGGAGGAAYAQPEEALAHLVVAQPPAAVHVQDLRRTDGRAQRVRTRARADTCHGDMHTCMFVCA
jgi:hypothetical protein